MSQSNFFISFLLFITPDRTPNEAWCQKYSHIFHVFGPTCVFVSVPWERTQHVSLSYTGCVLTGNFGILPVKISIYWGKKISNLSDASAVIIHRNSSSTSKCAQQKTHRWFFPQPVPYVENPEFVGGLRSLLFAVSHQNLRSVRVQETAVDEDLQASRHTGSSMLVPAGEQQLHPVFSHAIKTEMGSQWVIFCQWIRKVMINGQRQTQSVIGPIYSWQTDRLTDRKKQRDNESNRQAGGQKERRGGGWGGERKTNRRRDKQTSRERGDNKREGK